jgi:2-polyprenyl-3-methyl-5-hydroxy-6-metoxy-1,4-benzoquinol methylase
MESSRKLIDPQQLIENVGVDDLNKNADKYYENIEIQRISAKPFTLPASQHLFSEVSHLLSGLKLLPGDRILDFGCGVGWLPRFLYSMGCEVVGVDVSNVAITKAKELSSEWIKYFSNNCGLESQLDFCLYNGHGFHFDKESFDHIIILDSFHHVPNQSKILSEFYRVLKPGGKVAFCEPGPNHSDSHSAQLEMSLHQVLENNIDIFSIWQRSKDLGFVDIDLFLTPLVGKLVSLNDYKQFPENKELTNDFVNQCNWRSVNYPIFFITKEGNKELDTRRNEDVGAEIEVYDENFEPINNSLIKCKLHEEFTLILTAKNLGKSTWLPSGSNNGCVNIGIVCESEHGYGCNFRSQLSVSKVSSGDSAKTSFNFPKIEKGVYNVEINLVSEFVCWFSESGCESKHFKLVVD